MKPSTASQNPKAAAKIAGKPKPQPKPIAKSQREAKAAAELRLSRQRRPQ